MRAGVGTAIAAAVLFLIWLPRWLFPPVVFLIGEGERRYADQRAVQFLVIGAVVVGFFGWLAEAAVKYFSSS